MLLILISYSLGDAIDWKLKPLGMEIHKHVLLLLARGRDRLETEFCDDDLATPVVSYSLGDAIDWKQT